MQEDWQKGKVSIDGIIVEPRDATISIFDRGFLFGDSVFETLRVYKGHPFAFNEHIDRFFASGKRIGFELPWKDELIKENCLQTLEASGLGEAYMRVIGTRGMGPLGLDPSLATNPHLLVIVLPLPDFPDDLYKNGRTAALVSVRRNLKMAVDPQAKTGNYMNSVMAVRDAKARGAHEAIMLNVHGNIAEGSSANVFAFINGVWCTPSLDVGILGGITRRTLLELCETNGIDVEVRIITLDEFKKATEILLCSSVRELVPLIKLDETPVGTGEVGGHFKKLRALYRAEVERCSVVENG